MKRSLLIFLCILTGSMTFAQNTYYVTTTADDAAGGFAGPQGTLRWAINQANQTPGLDYIYFDIPTTDPNYDPVTGAFTITLAINLEQIGQGGPVIIDGYTQPGSTIGNPKVQIIGSNNDSFQFVQDGVLGGRDASGSIVRGFFVGPITSFGVSIQGADDILVEDIWVGIEPDGSNANNAGQSKGITIVGSNPTGNNVDGICHDIVVRNCVFSGNALMGIDINRGENIQIQNCFVGTNKEGTTTVGGYGNGGAGIYIGNSENCHIENCVVGGNDIPGTDPNQGAQSGIFLLSTSNTTIRNNLIGVGTTGEDMGNGNEGILIVGGSGGAASNNLIEKNVITNTSNQNHGAGTGILVAENASNNVIIGNEIRNNESHGVYFAGGDPTNNIVGGRLNEGDVSLANVITENGGDGISVEADFNTLRFNSIFCNSGDKAIDLVGGVGNEGHPAPIFTSNDDEQPVTGTAGAGDRVDLYAMSSCPNCTEKDDVQGDAAYYLGSVTADGAGDFTYNGPFGAVMAATATNSNGSTSEFSRCILNDPDCIEPVVDAGNDLDICGSELADNKVFLNASGLGPFETGTWSVVSGQNSGSVSFGNDNAPTTTMEGLTSGPYVIRWTVINDIPGLEADEIPCTSFDEFTITVDPIPGPADAGEWVTVCGDGDNSSLSVELSANTPVNGTGSWSWETTPVGTISSANTANTTVSGFGADVNTLRWTIESQFGFCPEEINDVLVIIDNPVSAGPDIEICDPGINPISRQITQNELPDDGNQGNNTPSSWSYVGTLTPVPGIQNPQDKRPYLSFAAGASGIYPFLYKVNASECGDTMLVIIGGDPVNADAGSVAPTCDSEVTLNAQPAGNGVSGRWTLEATTGNASAQFDDDTDENTLFSDLTPGDYTIRWTVDNGCETDFDEITFTVGASVSDPDAGEDQSLCVISYDLQGSVLGLNETGTWSVYSGSGSFLDEEDPETTVSGLALGVNELIWSVTNGSCDPKYDTVALTVFAPPSTANAGGPYEICGDTVALNASPITSGTGTWSRVSGTPSPSFVNDNAPNTEVFNLDPGTTQLQWTVSTDQCGDSSDIVDVVVWERPGNPNAGDSLRFCATEDVELVGSTPASGTATWTEVNGTFTFGPTNENSPVANLGTLAPGSYDFQWEFVNGTCPIVSDVVNVRVDAEPDLAQTDPDFDACVADEINIEANDPDTGTGSWSVGVTSTGGDLDDASSFATEVLNMTGTDVFVGVWTITNGVCPPSSDSITVTAQAIAAPSVSLAQSDTLICEGEGITFSATPTNGGSDPTYRFFDGLGNQLRPEGPSNEFTYAGITTSDSVYVLMRSNSSCLGSNDPLALSEILSFTVDPLPDPANAGINDTTCTNEVGLNANVPVNGIGVWSVFSGSASISDTLDPIAIVSDLQQGASVVLQWTIRSGVCEPTSDTVRIHRPGELTTPEAGDTLVICETGTAEVEGNEPGTGETGYWTAGGNGTLIPGANPRRATYTPDADDVANGFVKLYWTLENTFCDPESDSVVVLIDALPSTAFAGLDDTLCTDGVTLDATAPTQGTGMWEINSGIGVIDSLEKPNAELTGLAQNSNVYLNWTISNGVCPPSIDSVVIVRLGALTDADAGLDDRICADQTTVDLTANTFQSDERGEWSTSGDGTFGLATNRQTTYSPAGDDLVDGTVTLTWTMSKDFCPSDEDGLVLTIDPVPSDAVVGESDTICGATTTLNADPITAGTGQWTFLTPSSASSPTATMR